MIEIQTNGAEFMAQLDAAIAEMDRQLDEAFFVWTMHVFKDLVTLYPQWSGDAASNWRYSIHSPSGDYTRLYTKDLRWGKGFAAEPPVQRGNFEAVSVAMTRALDGPRPSYADTVYFVNNTPIAEELEKVPAWVRDVNRLADGAVATAQFVADMWRNKPYDASYVTFP